ncbi:MAG: TolC family protein [Armatimonadetes bacterium]|nr:TolC family protein [Armatimonadota bacterium]
MKSFAPLLLVALCQVAVDAEPSSQVAPPIAAPAPQSPPRLSLQECLQQALQGNPSLQAARQRMVAAGGRLTAARALPNPEVQVVPVGSANDNPVIVTQVFEVLGKRKHRARTAESEKQVAEHELRAVELAVLAAVSAAYVDLQEAERAQALAEEAAKLARSLHEAAQRQFDLGDVARAHVVRTRLQVGRVEQESVTARGEVAVRAAALNWLLGREAATPVAPAEELQYAELEPAPELKARALTQRPEVQAAEAGLSARSQAVELARAQRNPDLFFQTRLGHDDGGGRSGLTALGLTVPGWDWGSVRGQVREAQANLAEQRALLTAAQNAVSLEVEAALRRLQTSREIVQRYQTQVVPDAEELMKMTQVGYEQGATGYLEVIDAQQSLTDARTALARAVAEHQRNVVELRRAAGEPFAPAAAGAQTVRGGEQ